jgi:hypothetical protein
VIWPPGVAPFSIVAVAVTGEPIVALAAATLRLTVRAPTAEAWFGEPQGRLAALLSPLPVYSTVQV